MRHPWLARYVPDLADMVHAADAPDESADVVLWTVPPFVWRRASDEFGRKGHDRSTGGRLDMPVRVQWDGPSVSKQPAERTGRAVGPGIDERVRARPVGRSAGEIRADGWRGRWSLFVELEVWAGEQVARAAAARHKDMAASRGSGADAMWPALDSLALESISSALMVADGGAFERMCALLVRPTCFERTDPLRWIRMTLAREADQEICRALGDVWTGPRLRRLAAADPHLTEESIAARFNAGHVRQVTVRQVRRALRAGRARRVPLGHDLSDVIDQLASSPSAEDVLLGAASWA